MTNDFLLLDMRTMSFASSVSGFLMAATMLGIYHAGMRARAMLDWLVAGLALGAGYLVGTVALVGALPLSGSLAVALANLLVSVGHSFVLVGLQRYLGNRAPVGLYLGVIAALFIAGLALEPLRESLGARIAVFSLLHLVLTAWAGGLLWRSDRPGMRPYHRMAAAVLLSYSAVIAFRLLAELMPSAVTPLVQEGRQAVAFLAAMVFGFLLTMAFAVMLFREKQVELANLAKKDPLTGMNNRLSLDAIAARYMQRSEADGKPLSIMLFDLDHFKRVNDACGHQVGDRVLLEIARRIGQVIRGDDIAFRFGGEEFIALLPGASLEQAEQVAERLRSVIADQPVQIAEHRLKLTASLGVAQYMPGRENWDDCVKRADEALYRAKRGGRDRISLHVPVSIAGLT